MPRTPIETFTSPYMVIANDGIDTDQIIPARFLKTIDRSGLGQRAFYDWRYDARGEQRPDFPLNSPIAAGARVLVAGRNFGCGSSREHAVWALMGAGFQAVVSTTFADIFRGNAIGNGLIPIEVEEDAIAALIQAAGAVEQRTERPQVIVDLQTQVLTLPTGKRVTFPIAPFAKHCLLHGVDELDVLLEASGDAARYEEAHATMAVSTSLDGGAA
jgi:3-isopropylmalate/(R)-2-methylmalate dehydratase small subunit